MRQTLSKRDETIMADTPRTTFLTVAEVADMVRVSRMTVYRWVHAGELPAVRFGRSFRVPHQAVEHTQQSVEIAQGRAQQFREVVRFQLRGREAQADPQAAAQTLAARVLPESPRRFPLLPWPERQQ